jgi:hypothetical protein
MQASCRIPWSKWKTQRQQLLQNNDNDALFNTQLGLFPNNASLSHLVQDFVLARVPAAYYYTHKKGEDKIPRFSSSSCRRYAIVDVLDKAGLGHRMSNFLQGALIADTFEINQVIVNIDLAVWDSLNGAYTGMTEFLGLVTDKDFVNEDIKDITMKMYEKIRYEAGLYWFLGLRL